MKIHGIRGITIFVLLTISTSLFGKLHLSGHAQWKNFIYHLLNQYKRPITILELGASKESLSFDIVRHYDATCVMIDWDNVDQLAQQCTEKQPDNIILLGKNIGIHDLQKLGECEHFDVVILADILPAFEKEWNAFSTILTTLGDYVIIKNIPAGFSTDTIKNYMKYVGCCYFLEINKNRLHRTAWNKERRWNKFYVKSTFTDKKLYKGFLKLWSSTWIRGINLYTFKGTQGVYPTSSFIKDQIKKFAGSNHNDIWLGNMVLQGKSVKLIDFDDSRRNANPHTHLQKCLDQMS